MKEYRLIAWPQLRAPFDRTGHRRVLSNMSQRHVSLGPLADASGMRRAEIRAFVRWLLAEGWAEERDMVDEPDSLFGSLRPLGGWLRRAWTFSASDR